MQLHKYHAWGNDIIIIDPAAFSLPLTPARIRLMCDRHLGVGGDGISYGPIPNAPRANTLRFFNPDGTEAEKSGNGMRTFARYLWDTGYVSDPNFTISINNEIASVRVLDAAAQQMAIGMGQVSFRFVEEIQQFGEEAWVATAVSIGNPHCVIFTDELDHIYTIGPIIENAPQFPQRTNVQLVQVIDERSIKIEIWERGAGYTLASGTCSSAAAATAVKTGRCQSPVTVHMAGGVGQVEINEQGQVVLTGAVTAVYAGTFSADMQKQLTDLKET
jgi:diaminopimelate epimerase